MTSNAVRVEIQRINWHRAPVFFAIMLVWEPLSIFSDALHLGGPASQGALYLGLHLALFFLAAGSLTFWAVSLRKGWTDPAPVEAVTAAIGTLGLTLIAAVSVADTARGEAATAFLANLLVSAALALFPFRWAIMVYGVPSLFFFVGVFLFVPSTRLLTELPNAVIFSIAALFIARFQYRNEEGLLKTNAELDFLSHHDPLTGLANRSQFQTRVEWQQTIQRRSGKDSALVLVDLDRFKAINDVYGHPMGDEVLKKTALVLRDGLRDVDCVCRWGGEEFLLLLVETPLIEAASIAERLRLALESTPIQAAPLSFTGSFGVTGLAAGDTFQDAYSRVDAALYRAKAQGRNRVEVSLSSVPRVESLHK